MRGKGRRVYTCLLLAVFLMGILFPAGTTMAAEKTGGSGTFSQFSDVSSTDVNGVYINYLTAKGILGGFPDGAFYPDEGLTRAQAAVALCKAANLNPINLKTGGFKDTDNHWASGYIAAAVKAGYLTGFPDGTFKPDAQISRCQGISLILRLSQQGDPGVVLPQLTDMDTSHWAARSMAVAIDAGMIQVKPDNKIEPDKALSRGDLSRALALLLTQDPQLSSRKLYSTMTVKSGEVSLTRKDTKTGKTVTGRMQIEVGDTIETGRNGEAVINYPDGSSLLLKSNSTLVIIESLGRAYIKKDGQPGTTVDNLEVELKVGKLFGGLSSLAQPTAASESAPTTSMNKQGSRLLASMAGKYDLLAANTKEETPWYKTAEKKKVKVKVDMPWGIAAIRGSFWNSAVNANGSGSTNLLEGSAQVTAGGQTVSLSPGESSGGSSSVAPPSPPAPMTQVQLSEWSQVQSWVQSTFDNMSQNPGAPPPGTLGNSNNSPSQILSQTLNQALSQAYQASQAVNTPSTTTSTTTTSSDGASTTPTPEVIVSLAKDNFTMQVNVKGSMPFSVCPTDATITVTTNTNPSVATLTLYYDAESGSRYGVLQSGSTPGTTAITITNTYTGYQTTTKTITVNVVPVLSNNRVFTEALATNLADYIVMTVFDSTDCWTTGDTLSVHLINGYTGMDVTGIGVSLDSFDGDFINCTVGAGLVPNLYCLVVEKPGVGPIGSTAFWVTPYGNIATITGVRFNQTNGILTIFTQGVEAGPSFYLDQLSYNSGSGSHDIMPGLSAVSFDSSTGILTIILDTGNIAAITSLSGYGGSDDFLNAASGWNKDNASNPAGAVTGISVEITN